MFWICAGCEGVVADGVGTCPACGSPPRPFVVRLDETHVFHLARPPTWIELQVEEFPRTPAAGFSYRIETANGEVLEGTLDPAGRVHLEHIAPGTCKVTVFAR